MKKILLLIFTFGVSISYSQDLQPDIAAGEEKAALCTACHGSGGVGINPLWPRLAGQHASYAVKEIQEFKSGARKDPVMQAQANLLSDQDVVNVAAYFASQDHHYDVAVLSGSEEEAQALLQRGEALYRGGDIEKGVTACSSCHGPSGLGIAEAAYPALAGQYSPYVVKQLEAFRLGSNIEEQSTSVDKNTLLTRENDPNKMMRDIANKLTDRDIEALANYIQGLRP